MITHCFRAMNTEIELLLELTQADAQEAVRFAEDWFEICESRFSRFRRDSELMRVNRSGSRPMIVSAAMLELLGEAERYRVRTSGLFDVRVYDALLRAGYGESFELLDGGEAATGSSGGMAASKSATRNDDDQSDILDPIPSPPAGPGFLLDEGMSSVRLLQDCRLDLGGIAKSWTVRRLAGWLQRHWGCARGIVNAGGDLMAWGGAGNDEPWTIAIDHPWGDGSRDCVFPLYSGAAATSSVIGRSWAANGRRKHHLIDPRTMQPAETDMAQCTVVGDDPVECEIAAKIVCMLGSKHGHSWLNDFQPTLRAVLWTLDGKRLISDPKWSVSYRKE